jgi:hypothetical protein
VRRANGKNKQIKGVSRRRRTGCFMIREDCSSAEESAASIAQGRKLGSCMFP